MHIWRPKQLHSLGSSMKNIQPRPPPPLRRLPAAYRCCTDSDRGREDPQAQAVWPRHHTGQRCPKSKTAVGGLKQGWQKAVGLVAAVSKSKNSAVPAPRACADSNPSTPSLMSSRRSMASVTMRSATSSIVSLPTSSVVSFPLGEFDGEEDPASLAAARGVKSSEAIIEGTAKASTDSISLVQKDIKLSVTGQ
ncbi:hypothetical protein B0H19DRAFT_1244545, partial [Mycena capillaripes]